MLFGKVKVEIDLRKCNENIYLIMGKVRQAMFKAKKLHQYDELWNKVMKTKKYDEAMKVIKKYVKIIDTSNRRKI